jgi:hypothetical protein
MKNNKRFMKIKKFNEDFSYENVNGWKSIDDKQKVLDKFVQLGALIESIEIEIANARNDYGGLQIKYRGLADNLQGMIREWKENYDVY